MGAAGALIACGSSKSSDGMSVLDLDMEDLGCVVGPAAEPLPPPSTGRATQNSHEEDDERSAAACHCIATLLAPQTACAAQVRDTIGERGGFVVERRVGLRRGRVVLIGGGG